MIAFIVAVIIILLLYLLFGKSDTKRTILHEVGLDLSPEHYESQKEKEFAKYCVKALYNAIDLKNCVGNNEIQFLNRLSDILSEGAYGDEENNLAYLRVKSHYLKHADRVVCRRIEKIRNGDTSPLLPNCDFSQKSDVKKYIKILWGKYQYPWPKDWLQGDSDL